MYIHFKNIRSDSSIPKNATLYIDIDINRMKVIYIEMMQHQLKKYLKIL